MEKSVQSLTAEITGCKYTSILDDVFTTQTTISSLLPGTYKGCTDCGHLSLLSVAANKPLRGLSPDTEESV